jgi:hypothetical protein
VLKQLVAPDAIPRLFRDGCGNGADAQRRGRSFEELARFSHGAEQGFDALAERGVVAAGVAQEFGPGLERGPLEGLGQQRLFGEWSVHDRSVTTQQCAIRAGKGS